MMLFKRGYFNRVYFSYFAQDLRVFPIQALVRSNKPKEFATSLIPCWGTLKDKDFSSKKTVAK